MNKTVNSKRASFMNVKLKTKIKSLDYQAYIKNNSRERKVKKMFNAQ